MPLILKLRVFPLESLLLEQAYTEDVVLHQKMRECNSDTESKIIICDQKRNKITKCFLQLESLIIQHEEHLPF